MFRAMTLIGCLLVTLLLAGCEQKAPPAKPPQPAPGFGLAAGCNVLLLTLDTTRADRLGCYGYPSAQTPELDALAQDGARFDQAFANVPITLPSHTGILTGTLPPESGVRDNQRYALGSELPTLAEQFKARNYHTAAFIAARVLHHQHGLARGFDVYEDDIPLFQRPANEVCDLALDWLSERREQPFLAWVHLYDPHWPYEPPPGFRAFDHPYDGEVAFMDAQIGRLIAWLRTEDLLKQTLIVAVGDHGESLGEHGYDWHALLVYDNILRVPLIFHLPERIGPDRVFDGLVSLRDIMPTILDLLGWPTPAECTGRSLRPVFVGQELAPQPVYGESDFPYENFQWARLRCLIDPQWKYIRAPRVELYDRRSDPGELRNLADANPDVVTRLEDALADWEYRMPVRASQSVTLDSDSLEALRSLGYVGAPPPAPDPDAVLKDPKDMVDIANNHRIAESLLGQRKPLEALALVAPAVARSPESFVLVELLGKCYAGAGLVRVALKYCQDALQLQPQAPDTWLFVARLLQAQGALEDAVTACQEVLRLDSRHEEATRLLPQLEAELESQRARLAELRERYRQDPSDADVALALAHLHLARGELRDGVTVLKAALERHPAHVLLANSLAWVQATTEHGDFYDPAAALRWARVAAAGVQADDPGILDTLAAALAAGGDYEAAVATATRAQDLAAQTGDSVLAAKLAVRLQRYRAGEAYREP